MIFCCLLFCLFLFFAIFDVLFFFAFFVFFCLFLLLGRRWTPLGPKAETRSSPRSVKLSTPTSKTHKTGRAMVHSASTLSSSTYPRPTLRHSFVGKPKSYMTTGAGLSLPIAHLTPWAGNFALHSCGQPKSQSLRQRNRMSPFKVQRGVYWMYLVHWQRSWGRRWILATSTHLQSIWTVKRKACGASSTP